LTWTEGGKGKCEARTLKSYLKGRGRKEQKMLRRIYNPQPYYKTDFRGGLIPAPWIFTRASISTNLLYTDPYDFPDLNEFGVDVPIFRDGGLLMAPVATNFLLESASPADQVVDLTNLGAHILWSIGTGTVTVSAGTAVGTGFGTSSQGVPVVFNLTTVGTVQVTLGGTLDVVFFQLERGEDPTPFIITETTQMTRAASFMSAPIGLPGREYSLLARGRFEFVPATTIRTLAAVAAGVAARTQIQVAPPGPTGRANKNTGSGASTILGDTNLPVGIVGLGTTFNSGYFVQADSGIPSYVADFGFPAAGGFTDIVLGGIALAGNSAQWNGTIYSVAIYDRSLLFPALTGFCRQDWGRPG
jgi:hypothetical protein